MKRTIKILITIIVTLIVFLGIKSFAADSSTGDSLKLESVKVTSPSSGIYGVGQEINITFTFNKAIKGVMPKYTIYFGNDSSKEIELEAEDTTNFTTTVLYKYTIKSGDNGELKPGNFVNSSEYVIEDENGGKWYLSSPFMTRFEDKILASTTIKWTNFENSDIKMISEDTTRGSLDIKVENCTLNTNNSYYVHFSHNKNENIVLKSIDDIYDDESGIWQATLNPYSNKINMNADVREFIAEAGDIYITICEIDSTTNIPKIVVESEKIERLPQLPITQRITAFFFDDSTSTYCWEMYGENARNLNYKIGRVTDINLLRAIKNGDGTALNDLMEYAKKSSAMATGTLKLGDDVTITDKLDLIDDEYYYIYLQMDTENGKYYQIEDVSLYQALVSESVGKNLFSIADKEFEWNLSDEDIITDDNTVVNLDSLPNAGATTAIIMLIIITIISSIIFYKKCKLYKDVK